MEGAAGPLVCVVKRPEFVPLFDGVCVVFGCLGGCGKRHTQDSLTRGTLGVDRVTRLTGSGRWDGHRGVGPEPGDAGGPAPGRSEGPSSGVVVSVAWWALAGPWRLPGVAPASQDPNVVSGLYGRLGTR